MRVEEVTVDWVTQALQQRYPGVEVTRMEHGRFVAGTGSKLQLKLSYNAEGERLGLPPSMFLKGGLDWHSVAFKASYQAEAIFFEAWRPRIEANLPRGYFAAHNDDQGLVLMEDLTLRACRFTSFSGAPLTADIAEKVLKLQARIHAALWEDPALPSLRSLGERVDHKFTDLLLEPAHYARCLKERRGSTIPAAFHDEKRTMAALKANWALVDTGPQTFCHGDPHIGNMFFDPDGAPGYLDFQAYVRCTALHDVNYMIVGSLEPSERRAHERDLLALYLAELRALGVPDPWDPDEAWGRYRRHTIHGLTWFTVPPEMQPIEVVEAHGLRFGEAAGDYDLAGLLGV